MSFRNTLPDTSYVTLGKFLNLYALGFFTCKIRVIISPISYDDFENQIL